MHIFQREIRRQIEEKLFKGKVIILYGPRQVGKTTLVKEIIKSFPESRYISCDELDVQEMLTPNSHEQLKSYIGNHKIVILDEAQKIENIGTVLKILVDFYPEMQIIATGSSSFDLANKVGEPLVGRNYTFYLYPLSIRELPEYSNTDSLRRILENYMIYGSYPGIVIEDIKDKKDFLNLLVKNYLYKDILSYNGIRRPIILQKLLKLLAYQMGSEISYKKIADTLSVNISTIESYISILGQSFIIFVLPSFHRNKRTEIKRFNKIYFWDLGIRNALIGNFDQLEIRPDKGVIFENFFIAERLKQNSYEKLSFNPYFWRTIEGQEIDFIEEYNENKIKAFECKWNNSQVTTPSQWKKLHKDATFEVVTKNNIIDYLK